MNKIVKTILTFQFSLLIALYAAIVPCSCINSMDGMINDYNANINTNGEDPSGGPDGENTIDFNDMLKDKYIIAENMTVTLAAPYAEFYEWNIYKRTEEILDPIYGIKQEIFTPIDVKGAIPLYNRTLSLYLPDLSFALVPGETYKIRLVVEVPGGKRYSDEALLVVYKYFEL